MVFMRFLPASAVTNEYYPMLAKVMFELAVKLQKETGAHISLINFFGGIRGIPITAGRRSPMISA